MDNTFDLEGFINGFKSTHKEEIEDLFLNGYCFHFAIILQNICHYKGFPAEIMYVPIYNHFCCEYNGELYDIKGKIVNKAMIDLAEPWNTYFLYDQAESDRIKRDCIFKDSPEEDL